jgi:hypothetical protein
MYQLVVECARTYSNAVPMQYIVWRTVYTVTHVM